MTSKLAKDVASELESLESRRRRRRLVFLAGWAAAIVAALVYLRCGRGWGTGGKGPGSGGAASGSAQPAGPKRCVVRVSARGISVDGASMTRDQAVAACKQTEGAWITVTGDARQGDWDELKAALDAAGVKMYTRGH
jgi:hypothetical protein